jgi:putative intracellular protease/amidase
MKHTTVIFVALFLVVISTHNHADNNKNILIVLTSNDDLGESGRKTGFWLPELTHPYYAFLDAGYSVDVASIQGGMAPIDSNSYDSKDQANNRFLSDATLMRKVIRSEPLASFKAENYAAVIYSGGSGPMWDFPDNQDVLRITRNMYEKGGVVAAICHGPVALVNVKLTNGDYLIKGKRVTSFTNDEEIDIQQTDFLPFLLQDKLTERGANFVNASLWSKNVVADERLVTGQNPASAAGVAEKVIEILEQEQ